MIIWQIPDKNARVELDHDGWWVYHGRRAYLFGTHRECLCFMAGRGLISIDQIGFLCEKARERFQ